MGIASSRKVLHYTPEPRKSEVYPRPNIESLPETDRLVRDELRKEIQRGLLDKEPKTRNRVSVLQVAPKSIQQTHVRSILPLEKNQVSRS